MARAALAKPRPFRFCSVLLAVLSLSAGALTGRAESASTPDLVPASQGAPPPSRLAIISVNAGRPPVAGAGFAVIVQARDAGGAPRDVPAATRVSLSLRAGAGILGGTLAGTIPAGASRITIRGVTYTRAESGVVLSASRTTGPALAGGDSAPFTVDPGPIASYEVAFSSPQAIGSAFGIAVTARDRFGNTVTTDSSTAVTMHSASGHVLFDVNGDGVFGDSRRALSAGTLTVTAKGTVVETTGIIASDARGKRGSAPLTLTAGAPAALAFINQPRSAVAGIAIGGPPTVAVRDAFGNAVASSNTTIEVAIGANPGNGILKGTAMKGATQGIASFGDLTIDQPGTGYTLTASATGLTGATSAMFNVSAGTGAISGRITRANGGTGVAGASVHALLDGLSKGAAMSNPDGTYAIAGLAPGVYSVRASASGHQPVTREGVTVSAGGGTTLNFSLAAALGPAIRITSPPAGSTSGSLTVLVRGEISGAGGADVGVSVNEMPGFLDDNGGFVALVPVSSAVTALTASLNGRAGVHATDSIPFFVQTSAAEPPIGLRATPSGGVAPLAVAFDLSAQVSVSQVTLDVNGDGAPDYQGPTLSGTTFTFGQPGVYPAQVTAVDPLGLTYTAATVVQVFDRQVLDQRLQAVWQGAKDALRAGNVGAAVSFIHSDMRDRYQAQFSQLNPGTLANVDQIMTSIALVEVGFAGAQYEMLRLSDGQVFSYAVWFQLDLDGLWRIRRF